MIKKLFNIYLLQRSWFHLNHEPNAPVAQLDRVLDYESRGRGFESSPVRHFLPVFWINSMIPVDWTIYRDRFWDHSVRFCCISSKLDRQRGLIRLTVKFKTRRWTPRCQNSPPMSLDARTVRIAIKETFLKSSDSLLKGYALQVAGLELLWGDESPSQGALWNRGAVRHADGYWGRV